MPTPSRTANHHESRQGLDHRRHIQRESYFVPKCAGNAGGNKDAGKEDFCLRRYAGIGETVPSPASGHRKGCRCHRGGQGLHLREPFPDIGPGGSSCDRPALYTKGRLASKSCKGLPAGGRCVDQRVTRHADGKDRKISHASFSRTLRSRPDVFHEAGLRGRICFIF